MQHQLGKTGENLARKYLGNLGWEIIQTNWRCELGEIDVIAQDGSTRVFVEVRTRRGSIQDALDSVDEVKQSRLADLVEAYCAVEHYEGPVRVDVLGIALMPDGLFAIEMVRDALSW